MSGYKKSAAASKFVGKAKLGVKVSNFADYMNVKKTKGQPAVVERKLVGKKQSKFITPDPVKQIKTEQLQFKIGKEDEKPDGIIISIGNKSDTSSVDEDESSEAASEVQVAKESVKNIVVHEAESRSDSSDDMNNILEKYTDEIKMEQTIKERVKLGR